MTDYTKKTYGRNEEVADIFNLFKAGKDISQHGPRRLGKTFVLDRMVEQANAHNFICIKVEIAGCTEPKMVFRRLCEEIAANRTVTQRTLSIIAQRMAQAINPRGEQAGPWYQPFLNVDWEKYLDRLLGALQDDQEYRWAILIDELPIFLKALHDKETTGVNQARDFMNLFSQLRSKNPLVRWLITGSIGIDPLARAGQYMGALAKFHPYQLGPLSEPQSIEYLKDLAQLGLLQGRKAITDQEAQAVIEAVGWRAAFYLEAFANKLPANPETDIVKVRGNIEAAMAALLKPHNKSTLGTWEEHIRKHHSNQQRILSFDVLNAIAPIEEGMTLDALHGALGNTSLKREILRQHLMTLIDEGFLYQEPFNDDNAPYRFRIAVLRQWWKTYRPQA